MPSGERYTLWRMGRVRAWCGTTTVYSRWGAARCCREEMFTRHMWPRGHSVGGKTHTSNKSGTRPQNGAAFRTHDTRAVRGGSLTSRPRAPQLFADKAALENRTKVRLLEIRARELTLYTNNCRTVGTVAAVMAGLAYSGLVGSPQPATGSQSSYPLAIFLPSHPLTLSAGGCPIRRRVPPPARRSTPR